MSGVKSSMKESDFSLREEGLSRHTGTAHQRGQDGHETEDGDPGMVIYTVILLL